MPEFLMLFHSRVNDPADLPEGEWEPYLAKWADWLAQMQAASIIRAAAPLENPSRTLMPDGSVRIDGPSVERREVIGGFVQIAAPDIGAAEAWARKCPIFQVQGRVELREVRLQRLHDLLPEDA